MTVEDYVVYRMSYVVSKNPTEYCNQTRRLQRYWLLHCIPSLYRSFPSRRNRCCTLASCFVATASSCACFVRRSFLDCLALPFFDIFVYLPQRRRHKDDPVLPSPIASITIMYHMSIATAGIIVWSLKLPCEFQSSPCSPCSGEVARGDVD